MRYKEYRIQNTEYRIQNTEYRIQNAEDRKDEPTTRDTARIK